MLTQKVTQKPDLVPLAKAKKLAQGLGFGSLITKPTANPKLEKSGIYYNAGVSLAPAKISGYDMCFGSTARCRFSCISDTGHGFIDNHYGSGGVLKSRIARTRALVEHPEKFNTILLSEMEGVGRAADRKNLPVAFRPDIFSDRDWVTSHPWMFDHFSDWEFYGYTKIMSKIRAYVNGDCPDNYHLTLSWSERLEHQIAVGKYSLKGLLGLGINIAVPFYDLETMKGCIPTEWRGIEVIDGDKSDLRFLDPKGVIVGLKTKLPNDRKVAIDRIEKSDGFFVGVSK